MNEIVKKLRDDNPYPEDVFLERDEEEWKVFHMALKDYGLSGDGFMGSFGRHVWNVCCDKLEELLKVQGKPLKLNSTKKVKIRSY